MSFGKLFTHKNNPRSSAILAVAKSNGLELEVVITELGNATAEHKLAHPLGKIPAFIGSDGFRLSEAIAIAVYVTSQNEKTTLLGKTKQDYATILRWMSFFNSDLLSILSQWYLPLLGRSPYNKKAVDDAAKSVEQIVGVIEEHLTANTYLAGERISLADLFGSGIISRGFEFFFDKAWRSAHPAVSRWFDTITSQTIWTEVVDKLPLLDTPALTNVPPKKADAPPKKDKVEKKAEKKAEKKVEKKEDAAGDDDDDGAPAEPKPKHALDLFPRATFALDEWKRQYSNNATPDALKWFWEKANFEEYSLWQVKYKYNDELTMTFMSNNLIGGFNNRLEASRKYLFGCASVYGENNASIIEGAFFIRGDKSEPVFDVAPDYESYEFTKLDHTKPEDKEYVEAQWSWDRPIVVDGKEYPHVSGKVFK